MLLPQAMPEEPLLEEQVFDEEELPVQYGEVVQQVELVEHEVPLQELEPSQAPVDELQVVPDLHAPG